MADLDPVVAAALDRLLPSVPEHGDWARVIADAGLGAKQPQAERRLPIRKRTVLLIAVIIAAFVAPLAAFGIDQGWWFAGPNQAPNPVSPIEFVTSGSWDGVPWSLVAYRSGTGLCWSVTPDRERATGLGGSLSCAPVVGVPAGAAPTAGALRITFLRSDPGLRAPKGSLPGNISGPVVAAATTVELAVFSDGKTLALPTVAAPQKLESDVRFYVAEIDTGTSSVVRVNGLDRTGKTVATIKVG